MKVFASLSAISPLSKSGKDSAAVDGSAEAAVKRYKEAMRQHKKAMRELHGAADAFTKALEAVARSFQMLAEDSRAPVAVQASGALLRGVEEVREGVVLASFLEEIDLSLAARFQKVAAEQAELAECRRRTLKADRTLVDLQSQCDKLRAKAGGGGGGDDSKANMAYLAEAQRRDEQEIECARLAAEFEDEHAAFAHSFGELVYEDMTAVTTETHRLLSALSYQFRKCEENLKAHPLQRAAAVAAQ